MPFDEYTQRTINGVFRHMGSARFDPTKLRPAKNPTRAYNKPAPGSGLWASPESEKSYAWKDFWFDQYTYGKAWDEVGGYPEGEISDELHDELVHKVYELSDKYGDLSTPLGQQTFKEWCDTPHFMFRLKPGARVLYLGEETILANQLRFMPGVENSDFAEKVFGGPSKWDELCEEFKIPMDDRELSTDRLRAFLLGNCPRTTDLPDIDRGPLWAAWYALGCQLDFEWMAEQYDAILYLYGTSSVSDAVFWAWDCDSLVVFNPDVVEQVDG